MFSCYLGDMFDLDSATMFRFPLRIVKMTSEPGISDTSFTQNKLTEHLTQFKQEVFHCLLFVNSIKSVSILNNF